MTCKRGKEGKEERRKEEDKEERTEGSEAGRGTKKMEFEFVFFILNAYSLGSPKCFCLEIWFYSKAFIVLSKSRELELHTNNI